MLTPQDEALLLLARWEREAEDNVRMKLAALQLGELFQEEIPCRDLKSTLRMPVSTTRRQCLAAETEALAKHQLEEFRRRIP